MAGLEESVQDGTCFSYSTWLLKVSKDLSMLICWATAGEEVLPEQVDILKDGQGPWVPPFNTIEIPLKEPVQQSYPDTL
jgi:hypothetical protein